jgi:hypothetical protein
MNRQTVSLCVVVSVGCLLLGLFWNSPSVGQGPAAQPGKVGKYQAAMVMNPKLAAPSVILWDTETGQMWLKWDISQGPWGPMATPVPKKK